MFDIDPKWDRNKRRNEAELVAELVAQAGLDRAARAAIVTHAARLVEEIRADADPSLMDVFLAEYGLSTQEGVALMCLAEALLRVPDAATIDALIEDKIAPSDWSGHLGHSTSPLVNASTWGLMLTGKVLEETDPGVAGTLRGLVKRLGEPVIRSAVGRAMREMGRQFVLGETIDAAMKRARAQESAGYTYSYDMLGEAAVTAADAARYRESYAAAIEALSVACTAPEIAANPGISVKLSALHPRFTLAKTERVLEELVPVVSELVHKAAGARMGLNIDAEEADRLALTQTVFERVLADPGLAGWEGFGVVVQAYGRRAGDLIDGLYDMAEKCDRRIMVRLVKGAYWDTEVKRAQVDGLADFPVFSRKAATDVSYLAHARKLLALTDRIYPQFATHNAHTAAAIFEMAKGVDPAAYEFQRLHGMGAALHELLHRQAGTRCRIYAPVGAHRDLLAYLVRRLLENGANSSFVHQILDGAVPAETVAACPFAALNAPLGPTEPLLMNARDLFQPERENSKGFDLSDMTELARIDAARPKPNFWEVGPILAGAVSGAPAVTAHNPATGAEIGTVVFADAIEVQNALAAARPWQASAAERASILRRAADLYEENFGALFTLLATEAGKTLPDAVAELREAADFLRFYAAGAERLTGTARGVFTCISPWNFPLAIFTGQIAAALAAGNGVLAKPAETTSAIAAWGVRLLHQAGVPREVLQFLPGSGRHVGAALTADPRVNGVVFTGSTATARTIQQVMALHLAPGTPLIAETGGLNAMIVDSTALPEQAVRDILASAFQSAGQRCSALRCLYVQADIAAHIQEMLRGAMDQLALGDPWLLSTDVGPVITPAAAAEINGYVDRAAVEGRLIHRLKAPPRGNFVAPAVIAVSGIKNLEKEVFGPVLHVATFKAKDLDRVIAEINGSGYGLTFGLHTRIDDRVQKIADAICAGNIYANRNQIGAVVGSQPFGGEGLSGTGPKAGGPHYLARFTRQPAPHSTATVGGITDPALLSEEIEAEVQKAAPPVTQYLPGPTGELNRYAVVPRPPLLCLGPGPEMADQQAAAVRAMGGRAVIVPARLSPPALVGLPPIGGLLWWGDADSARNYAEALAALEGPIVPLIIDLPDAAHVLHERHLCVDTTAAGGNASLLAGK